MLPTTENAIRAILTADPSMTPDMIKHTIRAANGKDDTREAPPPLDRIMSAGEIAKATGMTARNVRRLGRLGAFRRIFSPGAKRKPLGYSEQSVRDFIAGKNQKANGATSKAR